MDTKTFRNISEVYGVLGVSTGSPFSVCSKAYRVLVKKYHPDVTTLPIDEATIKFNTITEAYNILKALNNGECINFANTHTSNTSNTSHTAKTQYRDIPPRKVKPKGTFLRHKDLMSFISVNI